MRRHANAAEDDGGLQLQVFAVGAHRLFDLRCKLACGCQHQSANPEHAEAVVGTATHAEFVQHGQGEGRCFAGAGLGAGQQVLSSQNGGNGLCLNRGGGVVALLAHSFQYGRSQVQFIKIHKGARGWATLGGSICSAKKSGSQLKTEETHLGR